MEHAFKLDFSSSFTGQSSPELIEHVINHLFDDKITLASCALVARAWVEPAHYHLFSTICHDLQVYPERTRDLGVFLISTSHRARYVRELDLRKVVEEEFSNEYSESHLPLVDSGFMSTLLSSLPNLTLLNLSMIPFSGEVRAFEKLPPTQGARGNIGGRNRVVIFSGIL